MLGGVPFGWRGEKPGFGSFWEFSQVLVRPGSFPALFWEVVEALLERSVALCWSPVAACAVSAGFEIPLSMLLEMGTPGTHEPPAPAQKLHNSLLPLSPSLWPWLLHTSESSAQPVPGALYLEPAQGLVQ